MVRYGLPQLLAQDGEALKQAKPGVRKLTGVPSEQEQSVDRATIGKNTCRRR